MSELTYDFIMYNRCDACGLETDVLRADPLPVAGGSGEPWMICDGCMPEALAEAAELN